MSLTTRRVTVTFFGNSLGPLVSLVTAPLLARGLGVEGRGEVAAAIAPLILGATIANVGLPTAATYFVAKAPGVARFVAIRAGAALLATGIATLALIMLASPWLSAGNQPVQKLIIIAGLLVVPTMLIVLLQGIAAGLNAWNRILLERTISSSLRLLGIATLFLLEELTILSAVLVISLTPILGGFAYFGTLRQLPQEGMRSSVLAKYGGSVWIGAFSGIVLARIDQTLIAPLSSTKQLGLYAVAVALGELAIVANNSIREVIFTNLANDFDRVRLAFASRISSICALIVATPIALGTILLLPTVFGNAFAPAIPVTLILILAVIFGNPGSMAGVGLSAAGRPGRRSASLVAASFANVAAIIVLVPAWGAVGAAIATAIGNLISSNLNIYWLWRYEQVRPSQFYRFGWQDIRSIYSLGKTLLSRP